MKILKKILIVLVILTFTSLTALAARNIMKKIILILIFWMQELKEC